MTTQSFLALKFLSSKHRSFLVSFLTVMALLGVVVSVAAFLVVQAVMLGFSHDLRDKILGFSPHLSFYLSPGVNADPILQQLQSKSEVKSVERFVEGEAILQFKEEVIGVKVRGVDLQKNSLSYRLPVKFEEGEEWSSLQTKGAQLPGVMLGRELVASEGIFPALYDQVELIYPLGEVGPTGELEPVERAFRIVGTFKSGYYEYDSKMLLAEIGEVERLFGDQIRERFGVFLKDPDQADLIQAALKKNPEIQEIQIWSQQQHRLFSALKLERVGMSIVLGLMMLLASFNIISMLFLIAHERRREIAVLKSIGMSDQKIKGIFLRAGFWIGTLGGGFGILIGIFLCRWLATSKLPLPTPYYLDALPVDLRWISVLVTFGLAILLGVLAAVFPAREGERFSIIEALRYE